VLVLLSVVVAAGTIGGLMRHGSLARVAGVSVPGWVPAALVTVGLVQCVHALLLADSAPRAAGWWVAVGAGAVTVATLVTTAARTPSLRRAAVLALVGGGLNAAVMVPNGGMPVSAHAAERADIPLDHSGDRVSERHVVADGSTPLAMLGDVLPLSAGPLRGVLSVGDLLLLAAAGLAVHDLITGRSPNRSFTSRPNPTEVVT
jgi:hypothetical protein